MILAQKHGCTQQDFWVSRHSIFCPQQLQKLELSSTFVMLCATNCIMKILFVCNVAMFQEKLHSVSRPLKILISSALLLWNFQLNANLWLLVIVQIVDTAPLIINTSPVPPLLVNCLPWNLGWLLTRISLSACTHTSLLFLGNKGNGRCLHTGYSICN